MKENKDILNQLNKADKPTVPSGFFDTFSDDLMSKINKDDSFLEDLPKTNKPQVPQGFFDDFSESITQHIEEKPKTKIISLKIVLTVASIAAVFALVLLTIKPNQEQPILAEVEMDVQTEKSDELDNYLAYLDESSIVDYIVENDINIEDETTIDESVYSELDNELDDYYYGY